MPIKLFISRSLYRGCYRVAACFPTTHSEEGSDDGPFFMHPCGAFSVGGLSLRQRFNAAFGMLGDWWSQEEYVWNAGLRVNLALHAEVFVIFFLKGWRR